MKPPARRRAREARRPETKQKLRTPETRRPNRRDPWEVFFLLDTAGPGCLRRNYWIYLSIWTYEQESRA